MKKMLNLSILILLITITMFPFESLAISYEEWSYECRSITTGTVTLYTIVETEDGTKESQEIGSLPAGTYFNVTGFDYDLLLYRIGYYSNGSGERAYIPKNSPIRDAVVRVFFTDGSESFIPESVYNNPSELQSHLNRLYPGLKLNGDGKKPVSIDGSLPLEEQENPIIPTETKAKDPNTDTSGYVQGEWTEQNEISEEEKAFNATCPSRLKRTIWGYSDAHLKTKYEKINIGTYCCITNDFNDVVQIAYYKNGVKHSAYIEKSDILGNYSVYIDDKGESQTVYAGDPNYESIVANHEVTWTAETISQDLDGQVAAEKSKGYQSGSSGKKTNSDTEKSKKVNVSTIGLVTSTIYYENEKLEVPTSQLTFSENVPEDKQLAVIYAPRTGKCSLRKTESDKSKLLKKCKAGTVVIVLEYGEGHCKINYKGTDGYVSTDCLKFYGTNVKALGTGVLSYNGKTTGKTTINIRNAPDKSSETIDEWRTGTKVTFFSYENGWYEVENNGMHGYVLEKFLTIE